MAVMAEFDRLAGASLWPGFDPRQTPIAIYDGERTLLFRHPAPPAAFSAVDAATGARVYPGGVYEGVTANTSISLAGVPTATLYAPSLASDASTEQAGVMLHETFHVFQGQRHPTWRGNEAEAFTYPVEDATVLETRRFELEALRRGLAASDPAVTACWAKLALEQRARRQAKLSTGASGYERATELYEGLAQYVQDRAVGTAARRGLREGDVDAEGVRQGAYLVGELLALLLDRLDVGWRERLEANDALTLDALLRPAAASAPRASCGFAEAERASMRRRAEADARAVAGGRAEQRRAFLAAPGWTLRVQIEGAPWQVAGFDPLNVRRLSGAEILHTRFAKFAGPAGSFEALGRASLSIAAGAHPLFDGVRGLVVTGLPEAPKVSDQGDGSGALSVSAPGLTAHVRGASLVREGQTLTIRVRVKPR
jgi:hypothetical protein